MPYKDAEKGRVSRRKWHKENYFGEYRERQRQSVKDRKAKLKKLFSEYKDDKFCKYCGESENCCLDFHHIDPSEKEIQICKALAKGWAWDRLMKEIDKCEILCSNCHRKLHTGKLDASVV